MLVTVGAVDYAVEGMQEIRGANPCADDSFFVRIMRMR